MILSWRTQFQQGMSHCYGPWCKLSAKFFDVLLIERSSFVAFARGSLLSNFLHEPLTSARRLGLGHGREIYIAKLTSNSYWGEIDGICRCIGNRISCAKKYEPSLYRFKARSGKTGMGIGPFLCIKILILKLNGVVASTSLTWLDLI
jgi:hypothetical protein